MNSYLTAVKVDSSREIGKEDQILNTTDISMSLLFFFPSGNPQPEFNVPEVGTEAQREKTLVKIL